MRGWRKGAVTWLFFHQTQIAEIGYTGVVQLLKSATSAFLCVLVLLVLLLKLLTFQEMFITHKHHIHYLSASECKPCQSCGPPSAQICVQPHALSETGSSSSLSPASITEDGFFGSTNKDQVKLFVFLNWKSFGNVVFLPFLTMLAAWL